MADGSLEARATGRHKVWTQHAVVDEPVPPQTGQVGMEHCRKEPGITMSRNPCVQVGNEVHMSLLAELEEDPSTPVVEPIRQPT